LGKRCFVLVRPKLAQKKSVKVVCCLRNGASDPAIISRVGKRARQNDKLHAKVIWTPKGAIIGSANASSNGLPEEEELANVLIEAGIYVNNSLTLGSIESWFDSQFKNARSITKLDLLRAKEAREERVWGSSTGRKRKPSLIEALKSGRKEFLNQRIYLMLFDEYITPQQERKARSWAREKQPQIRERLAMPSLRGGSLELYEGWPKLPSDAYLIDVFYNKNRTTVRGPFKTFPLRISWNDFEYVLSGSEVRFGYKITSADRRVIRSASKELWRAARRRNGMVSISLAAPILLRHAAKRLGY
jgi:hypothetical protein